MSIPVIIADDHPLVRDGLRLCIQNSNRNIEIVGEAADGLEVLQIVKRRRADVFIIDITMPRLNGLDTARELIRRYPGVRIIMLSLHDSQAFIDQAMEIGARGYMTKEKAGSNVAEAICEVYAGHFYLSPDIVHYMVDKARIRTGKSRTLQKAFLTAKERKVLQLIAEGWAAKEIASELECATNTIHAHRRSLMTKLDIHKGIGLVRFALKEGILKL